MKNAVAFANNDVATIAWSYGNKPADCMGFALYRIDAKGNESPLPSHAVFPGGTIKPGQTTRDFPIQKFYWKDVYARAAAGKSGGATFRYRIVPLSGPPTKLVPMASLGQLITNEVTLGGDAGGGITAIFNRGLISTQSVSRALGGKPSKGALLDRIKKPGDSLRTSLAGDMTSTLAGFVARAANSGTIHAALYELDDAELVASLAKIGKRLHIVLANKTWNPKTGVFDDGDADARATLGKSGATKIDRVMADQHIGHNKFLVHVDAAKKPRAVLLGSTNWTANGLCAQTNNTLVVEDAALATRYLEYWKELERDTAAAAGDAAKIQGAALRKWDAMGATLDRADGTRISSWFSPNTPKARSNPKNEAVPPDMADVKARIAGAKHAVLFLAFNPGTPSLVEWAAIAQKANRDLFVRGCVTSPDAAGGFYYELKGIAKPRKVPGAHAPVPQDPRVPAADALTRGNIPEGWQKEILSAGFAIIHDKIIVIDPFSDDCTVVTGSHNLGHRASYNNDENLAVVVGNKRLAAAYATHVLDVYDHFAWRVAVNAGKTDAHLRTKPDEWMAKYFDAAGHPTNAQLRFWMNATAP